MKTVLLVLLIAAMTLVACGGDETPSESIQASTTSQAATESTAAGSTFRVEIEETGCEVTGPGDVTAGEYGFVLINSLGDSSADVRTVHLNDGVTYQDLLAAQAEPGDYVPLTDWGTFSLDSFAAVDEVLGENERGKVLVLDPGEHAIVVGLATGTWPCAPLTVSAG